MFYSGGAEVEDGVGLAGSDGGEFRWIELWRWQSFVGDGFCDLCAMLFESGWQVWIGAIAAREKNVFAADAFPEFVRERYATVCFCAVRDGESGLFCGAGGCWTDGSDLVRLPRFWKRETLRCKAVPDCVNCVFAGEDEPIEIGEAREASVQRTKVVGRRERD